MALDQAKKTQIQRLLENFLRQRARTIRRLKIQDLHINPFLIRILANELKLKDARTIVRWLVNQRLERGTVTSFGLVLQEVAKVFSEGTGVEGADIQKTREGRRYYIQVKSGPNTVPKDMGERISQLLRSARRRNRGSEALFGMCYGNREQVSGIVRQYVEKEGGIDWLAGREFWRFISDDPHCVDEIYQLVADASQNFRDDQGMTLAQIIKAKVQELEKEFTKMYGERGDEMWRKLLEHNS